MELKCVTRAYGENDHPKLAKTKKWKNGKTKKTKTNEILKRKPDKKYKTKK